MCRNAQAFVPLSHDLQDTLACWHEGAAAFGRLYAAFTRHRAGINKKLHHLCWLFKLATQNVRVWKDHHFLFNWVSIPPFKSFSLDDKCFCGSLWRKHSCLSYFHSFSLADAFACCKWWEKTMRCPRAPLTVLVRVCEMGMNRMWLCIKF